MVKILRAGVLHTRDMANILNEIIQIGGTTALTETLAADDIASWMDRAPTKSSWHVAEDERGRVLGFQWIEPAAYLPIEAAEIASFVRPGQTGFGIGTRLFEATRLAAKRLGYSWINANIRADNESGLIYYQSRGFETYGQKQGVRLVDGSTVDKVLKRFDL